MNDKFYFKAKREGFRARSVYKLMEIQNKYHIIKRGDAVLDLGCAPGSWLQVVAKWIGPDGLLLGVDLSPVRPMGNAHIWKENVLLPDFLDKLKVFLQEKGRSSFAVVLSDMAPKTKGIPYIDQQASLELSMRAWDIAQQVLTTEGHFVCKVFQSREAEEFLQRLRPAFSMVKMMGVTATKRGSKEMYYVCLGYKGYI